jgi:DNA-binding NtrC family response regulator
VVDDDRAMREMLVSLFEEQGMAVAQAENVDAAIAVAEAGDELDAVLSDIKMPGRSGIELVGEFRKLRPRTPVILMTAFGSIDSAVSAIRAGAYDYVTKPFEPEAVVFAVERAMEHRALHVENAELRRAVDRTASMGDLIGESPAMREIFSLIRRIANNRSSVLITGESGTGKDMIARTLHFHGDRAEKPFVPVNCTAIPEGLLESELFGHVKGAFTGAHAAKKGLLEKANGGTLFLDEIGDMGASLQGKLLRVLQDREVRPVGGTSVVHVDVRIIAATNQDLQRAIADGRFREDLFYRLNVIPVHIPPLRERPEDVPALIENFLRKHTGDHPRFLTSDAIQHLQFHPWRGNARELENVIERALALSDADTLGVADVPLPSDLQAEAQPASSSFLPRAAAQRMTLEELNEAYTDEVLALTEGNKVQAAAILGIDRKTLYRRAERRARNHGG